MRFNDKSARFSPGRGRRAQECGGPEGRGRARGRGTGGGARRGAHGLGASLLAVALSLGLCLGASAAGAATEATAPAQSTGGSVLGILVDNTPSQEDIDTGKFTGNDSYLGILVAAAESEDVAVSFMLAEGRTYVSVSVPYGTAVSPPNDPAWPEGAEPPAGIEGTPVFDRWCTDAAGTAAYDFGEPVLGPLTLWAGWAAGEPVDVVLDAGEGGVVPDPDRPDAEPARTLVVKRYPGAFYRELPVPVRPGYTFAGWKGADGAAVDPSTSTVPVGGVSLSAAWEPNQYWVHYSFNDGTGRAKDVRAMYGVAGQTFLTWAEAADGASEPFGKDFDGWNTRPDGTGTFYAGGSAMPDLTTEPDGSVSLYAVWKDEFTVEEGPFEVRFMTNDGTDAVYRAFEGDDRVAKGNKVPAFDDPKRSGYQFAGWYADEACAGRAWSFDEQVHGDLTLWAKWDMRLDVTVPVSVGFAVDADTGEATGPDADRYALKSRTVAPVVVERAALESRQKELEGFFELKDDAGAGAGEGATSEGVPDGARSGEGGSGGDAAWRTALEKTELSLGAGGKAVSLPFAGTSSTDEDGAAVWDSKHLLTDTERAAFRMDAFAYGGTSADDEWQGDLPCKALPLKLDLTVPIDQLKVRTDLDGPQKVTRLVLTVSAKA